MQFNWFTSTKIIYLIFRSKKKEAKNTGQTFYQIHFKWKKMFLLGGGVLLTNSTPTLINTCSFHVSDKIYSNKVQLQNYNS